MMSELQSRSLTTIQRSLMIAALALVAGLMMARPSTVLATVIKIAVVMPEGSTWTNTLNELADAVREESAGELEFKIYAGGISGDEADVLRKMRVNRLHAGGFSGVGLGLVLPEVRILELPLLFKSYAEIDFVKEKMFPAFAQGFEKKGYVLLGFAEAGFVYLFSNRRIDSVEGLRESKMWVWKGDRVAESFLDAFGVQAYPLQLADVPTGLDTGMIDSFYSPPLAAVAFQWYARVRYLLDFPMVNSTGALLMNRRTFNDLSDRNQEILQRLTRQFCTTLVQRTRRDNAEALKVLAESGIERITPSPDQIASFQNSAAKNYRMNIPSIYPQELFDQIQGLLVDFRQSQ